MHCCDCSACDIVRVDSCLFLSCARCRREAKEPTAEARDSAGTDRAVPGSGEPGPGLGGGAGAHGWHAYAGGTPHMAREGQSRP